MSIEVIKEIKNIESIAEEKVKTAHQQAKELILRAEEEGEELIKLAVNKEIVNGAKQVENAENDVIIQLEIKGQQNQKLCEEIRQKANTRFEEAVKMVMERIVNMNGNS